MFVTYSSLNCTSIKSVAHIFSQVILLLCNIIPLQILFTCFYSNSAKRAFPAWRLLFQGQCFLSRGGGRGIYVFEENEGTQGHPKPSPPPLPSRFPGCSCPCKQTAACLRAASSLLPVGRDFGHIIPRRRINNFSVRKILEAMQKEQKIIALTGSGCSSLMIKSVAKIQ